MDLEITPRRAYYLKNREKAIAYSAKWKRENRARANESDRISAAKMRALDPDRFRETYKRWRDANPDKANENSRRWHKRNPNYWWEWRCANIKNWIVKRARSAAKQKSIPFDLTEGDIIIPEICPALGIKLDITARRTADNSIALDRIIPSLGYVASNVRIISRRANFIKNNATADELEAIAAYIRREIP